MTDSGSYEIQDIARLDEIITLFNGISRVKRNPECSSVGTPDKQITIYLDNGDHISIVSVAHKRLLVQLDCTDRSSDESIYFGTEDSLYSFIEALE